MHLSFQLANIIVVKLPHRWNWYTFPLEGPLQHHPSILPHQYQHPSNQEQNVS